MYVTNYLQLANADSSCQMHAKTLFSIPFHVSANSMRVGFSFLFWKNTHKHTHTPIIFRTPILKIYQQPIQSQGHNPPHATALNVDSADSKPLNDINQTKLF